MESRELDLDQLTMLEWVHHKITTGLELPRYGRDVPIYELDPDAYEMDPGYWHSPIYRDLFKELLDEVRNISMICCSEEINEPMEKGDYDYLYGWLSSDIPFLFTQSAHTLAYPQEVILYDPKWRIHIVEYRRIIEVTPVPPETRNIFFQPSGVRRQQLLSLVRNLDHPDLQIEKIRNLGGY